MSPYPESSGPVKPLTEPAKIKDPNTPTRTDPIRRRCTNCPKFFWAIRKDHRFCSARCRKEFHENGTAYGKLRERLYKDIEKKLAAMSNQIVNELTGRGYIAAMGDQIVNELTARGYITSAQLDEELNRRAFVKRSEITAEGIGIVRGAVKRKRIREWKQCVADIEKAGRYVCGDCKARIDAGEEPARGMSHPRDMNECHFFKHSTASPVLHRATPAR